MRERARRREAWLCGERDTTAVLPGELSGPVQVKRPATVGDVEGADAAPAQTSAAGAASPDSTSDASSVESSSLGTPPPSDLGQDNKQSSSKVEVLQDGEDVTQQHSEQPQVVTAP